MSAEQSQKPDNTKLMKMSKDDLIGLAYVTALQLGGVTGNVVRRNINKMKKVELADFVAMFGSKV